MTWLPSSACPIYHSTRRTGNFDWFRPIRENLRVMTKKVGLEKMVAIEKLLAPKEGGFQY